MFFISSRKATSTSVIGGSAETRKRAASHCGRKFIVASVLCRNVDPIPGVSIRTTSRRIAAGCVISTSRTPFWFFGLASSVTKPDNCFCNHLAGSPLSTVSGRLSLYRTRSDRPLPYCMKVGIAVSGTTALGSTSSPRSAFISVLFPRLTCPRTARWKRPDKRRFSRSASRSAWIAYRESIARNRRRSSLRISGRFSGTDTGPVPGDCDGDGVQMSAIGILLWFLSAGPFMPRNGGSDRACRSYQHKRRLAVNSITGYRTSAHPDN